MHILHSTLIRIITVVLYYSIGFLLAWMSYGAADTHYAHAPGPRELILFFTLGGGIIWFIGAIILYSTTRAQKYKGFILAHFLVFCSIAIYVFFSSNTPGQASNEVIPDVVIEESGDTTTMYHRGNPIFYKVGDSVLINFIDSSRIDWNKVEHRKKRN